MHVVQQLNFIAEFVAAYLQQLQSAPHLHFAIEQRLVVERLRPARFQVP